MGEASVELQAQLNKNLMVKDISTVYTKGGYKLN